jgi:SAM-dependent methyltransferase
MPRDYAKEWEKLGRSDPFFAVLTEPKYHQDQLTGAALKEFFDSGNRYVEYILQTIRARLDPDFQPQRALDFGCGVGRLAIPLAARCQEVVGVDVSPSMLEKARAHCPESRAQNVELGQGNAESFQAAGQFDLVNSFVVLHHIPWPQGRRLFLRLVELVREGGIGVIQVVFASPSRFPRLEQALRWGRRWVPGVHPLANWLENKSWSAPYMQMHEYDLNRLFRLLADRGCHHVYVRYIDQNGPYGAMLFFQKKALEPF